MATDRITRVNELLKREIGERLMRLFSGTDYDASAVTVTHVEATRNLRQAKVFVSIRDHQDERPEIMAFIKRCRTELQQDINRDMKLKYTPRLSFVLDLSLEKGDHVLQILSEMEQEDGL